MAVQLKDPGPLSFSATIQQGGHDGGAWIVFPYDLKETYGKGNLVPVVATFDGVEYRGSIAKMGPEPLLLVRKDVRQKIGKSGGDDVAVVVSLDTSKRTVDVPADFKAALKAHAAAMKAFDGMAPSHRRDYVRWIEGAKQAATRERRIVKAVEMLSENKPLR